MTDSLDFLLTDEQVLDQEANEFFHLTQAFVLHSGKVARLPRFRPADGKYVLNVSRLATVRHVFFLESPHIVQHRVQIFEMVAVQCIQQVLSAALKEVACNVNILSMKVVKQSLKILEHTLRGALDAVK